jgi:hypothetical protein
MSIREEFFIERQGKRMVLIAGLLDEAHRLGLRSIDTELLQVPAEENGNVAICKARVEMEDGRTFSGIGDASPANVGQNIAPHIIRMSETRSKARALRDAVNVAAVALEEMGEDDIPRASQGPRSEAQAGSEVEPERTPGGATWKAANYLIKLLVDSGHNKDETGPFVAKMSAAHVKKKIDEYKPKVSES